MSHIPSGDLFLVGVVIIIIIVNNYNKFYSFKQRDQRQFYIKYVSRVLYL